MAEGTGLCVALLAAGQSRRFGERDKLCATFRGAMLGVHVVRSLKRVDYVQSAQHRLVITNALDHSCALGWRKHGFAPVLNPNAEEGMGTSVAQAARIARRSGSGHLLIALADMPLVPASHYALLGELAQSRGRSALIASSTQDVSMPPAVFGSDHFDALADLSGDQGARELLGSGETVQCPPEWLADIDTPQALTDLQ